jgi:hypothetical protein
MKKLMETRINNQSLKLTNKLHCKTRASIRLIRMISKTLLRFKKLKMNHSWALSFLHQRFSKILVIKIFWIVIQIITWCITLRLRIPLIKARFNRNNHAHLKSVKWLPTTVTTDYKASLLTKMIIWLLLETNIEIMMIQIS